MNSMDVHKNGFKKLEIKNYVLDNVELGYKFEYRDVDVDMDGKPLEPALRLHVSVFLDGILQNPNIEYVLYRNQWDSVCRIGDGPTKSDELNVDAKGENSPPCIYMLERARRDIGNCKDIEQLRALEKIMPILA